MPDLDAIPPAELAAYIIASPADDEALRKYEVVGAEIRADILRLLGPDWSFAGKRVLDFGCGSGRVLRQFLHEDAELHGCDISAECIAWVDEHLSPPLHVRQSGELPPLDYPSAHFDLIWTTSVFSHLTDSWSAWLLELHRLLKPDGILIATVMGAQLSEAIAEEPWEPDRIGMAVRGYGRPWSGGGPMVLHSEWWIRAHWGRAFEIVDHVEGGVYGQDGVLMRKRDVSLTPEELEVPEPGEPRELLAARHAIELLHREHAELNASHDAYAAAYVEEAAKREAAERERDELRARRADRGGLRRRLRL